MKTIILILLSALVAFPGFGFVKGRELIFPAGKGAAKGNGLFSPGGRIDTEGNGLLSSGDNLDGDKQEWFSPIAKPYAEGKELLALVETEEEARQIAEIYEIEFVHFANGVATYHTEEAPGAVVERGKENGWPEISVNYTRKAF